SSIKKSCLKSLRFGNNMLIAFDKNLIGCKIFFLNSFQLNKEKVFAMTRFVLTKKHLAIKKIKLIQ
ncbi:MAG: hypothetical protein EBU01_11290, partial [Crocinitomicaceae bacterium]|nr:hypothetical protein [Crocinitomicaceae bacterium]